MIQVFYSPARSNERIVSLLRQRPGLVDCDFTRLEMLTRLRGLEEISRSPQPIAYIWGDGEHHDDSYFFTRFSKAVGLLVKGNIDRHSDNLMVLPELHYGNHMGHTHKDGIRIVVPNCSEIEINAFLAYLAADIAGVYGRGSVALTVDCDGFPAFPCMERWIYEDGFDLQQVLRLIRETGPKLLRFDIGGFVGTDREFEFLPDGSVEPPTFGETASFSIGIKNFKGPVSKNLVNKVCSYAVEVYGKLLEAFVEAVSSNAMPSVSEPEKRQQVVSPCA